MKAKPLSEGPVGIIGAMDAEISEFLQHAELVTTTEWRGFTFYTVRLEARAVVLVKCGVGKVFSAMISQKLIDLFSPSCLIFTGVAGALNPAYEVGDVVVSHDCLQHDVDGGALGFPRGHILYSEYKVFSANQQLAQAALTARVDVSLLANDPQFTGSHKIHVGRILTGDQFMTREEIHKHHYLTEELAGDAVEMEGAAMAQVCAVNDIPFLLVRTISDKADGDAVLDFNRFLPLVAQNSFVIVRHILSQIR